jgi:hypothetical protein
VVKRIAPLLALVGAFAFAGVAWAGTTPFAGKFENGGTVSFDFSGPPEGKEEALVQNWAWSRFRIKCKNGKHRYSGFAKGSQTAVDPMRRFYLELVRKDGGGRAIVDGRFERDWQKATGTFKVKGKTSVGKRCRSGKVEWTAKAQPTG